MNDSEDMMYESEGMVYDSKSMVNRCEGMVYDSDGVMNGSEDMGYDSESMVPYPRYQYISVPLTHLHYQ